MTKNSTRHQTANAVTQIDYTGPKGATAVKVARSLSRVTQDFQGIGFAPVMINGTTNVLVNGDEKVVLNRA